MENVALDKTSKAQLSLILHYQTFLICVYSVQFRSRPSTRRIFTIQTRQWRPSSMDIGKNKDKK